jgi:OOP family OmpA-OmpF porin
VTKIRLCSTALLATALCIPGTLLAQPVPGYATWSGGVVKWGGGCIRASGQSTPQALAECDPQLAPKPAAAPAPAPAPRAEPAPPPPAPAAKPAPAAPVAKPAPAKPKPQTATFTELFASGSATLSPAARSTIDKQVLEPMRNMSSVSLVYIEGHTDRLGSHEANQKLSERRAAAVANYLVSKGVDRSKIETLGMGKTNPVKSCPDQKDRKKLVECLAPNRRVTVQITGMPR